jgi:Icc-related predicted phosphoesterase
MLRVPRCPRNRELEVEPTGHEGLHGHIHEGKGTRKFRKTLCINPGSMYEQGSLLGALIKLERGKIKNYVLTTG